MTAYYRLFLSLWHISKVCWYALIKEWLYKFSSNFVNLDFSNIQLSHHLLTFNTQYLYIVFKIQKLIYYFTKCVFNSFLRNLNYKYHQQKINFFSLNYRIYIHYRKINRFITTNLIKHKIATNYSYAISIFWPKIIIFCAIFFRICLISNFRYLYAIILICFICDTLNYDIISFYFLMKNAYEYCKMQKII